MSAPPAPAAAPSKPDLAPKTTPTTTVVEDPAMPSDPNSPDLELVIATPEEIKLLSEKNATAWRGPLKLDAYLRREVYLASQAFTKDGGVTHWVLVSKKVKDNERKILAGCETYRKRALVSRNGKVEEVQAHGIGSVFSEYRGKGYGARMMKELGEKLRTWQTLLTPNLFSVLYSDIGKKYYSALGWQSFPSSHVHIRPDASQSMWEKHGNVTPLVKTDLPNLCALDEKLMRKRLESYNEGTAVALLPDHKTIDWHHAREEFVANELYGKAPNTKGATADVNGQKVHAIWTRMYANPDVNDVKGNTMHILRIIVEDKPLDIDNTDVSPDHIAGIAAVLRAAQKEANDWHIENIEIWNPHPRTLAAAEQVDHTSHLINRDSESIASLMWYGEKEETINWLEVEKYGWC